MTPLRARLLLAALAALLVWGLLPASSPVAPSKRPARGYGDAALFLKVVARLEAGEPYYSAMGDELRLDNYPTTSPFNWRTPAHLVLVARASVPAATLVLKLLALVAVLATLAVLARAGAWTAAAGGIAQMGAVATAFSPDALGVSEIWAGVFVALSVCAYYRSWRLAGALLGVAAIFVRELAAPYGVACALLALRGRSRTALRGRSRTAPTVDRRREGLVWIAAGLAYGAYYAAHVLQVQAHQMPGDLAHTQPWLQWNGVRFTLATIGVNGWLIFVPRPAGAIYMVLALAGAASSGIAPQARWGLLAFAALFAIAGLPFNYYWGFVTAPLWVFGFAHALNGLRRIFRAAFPTAAPFRGGHADRHAPI